MVDKRQPATIHQKKLPQIEIQRRFFYFGTPDPIFYYFWFISFIVLALFIELDNGVLCVGAALKRKYRFRVIFINSFTN